ncbi:MAG: preprotein translocase subunit SecE [Candidatus Omnitrophota bacterium]
MEFIFHNLNKIIFAVLGVGVLAAGIKNYQKIKTFILEVKTELTKVSWSNRQELMGSTIVVIVITSVMTIYIGLLDLILSRILRFIFR